MVDAMSSSLGNLKFAEPQMNFFSSALGIDMTDVNESANTVNERFNALLSDSNIELLITTLTNLNSGASKMNEFLQPDNVSAIVNCVKSMTDSSDKIKDSVCDMENMFYSALSKIQKTTFIFSTVGVVTSLLYAARTKQVRYYSIAGMCCIILFVTMPSSISVRVRDFVAQHLTSWCSSTDGDVAESQAFEFDFIKPMSEFLTMIISFFGADKRKGKMANFREYLDKKVRIEGSIFSVLTTAVEIIQYVVNWVSSTIGGPVFNFMQTHNEEFEKFSKTVMEIEHKVHHKQFPFTTDNYDTLCRLVAEGEALYKDISTKREDMGLAHLLNAKLRILDKLKQQFTQTTFACDGVRQEPVGVLLFGEPASGKSQALEFINTAFCERTLPPEMIPYFQSNPSRFMYNRQVENKFWEGYNDFHHVCTFDDFGQCNDIRGEPDNEYFNVIRAINEFNYTLHMAEISAKANTTFKSKLVTASTNRRVFTPESIVSANAFMRRWDIQADCDFKPEFRSLSEDSKMKLDPTKLPVGSEGVSNIAPDHLQFRVTKGPKTGMMDFDELMDMIVDWYHVKTKRYLQKKEELRKIATGQRNSFDPLPTGVSECVSGSSSSIATSMTETEKLRASGGKPILEECAESQARYDYSEFSQVWNEDKDFNKIDFEKFIENFNLGEGIATTSHWQSLEGSVLGNYKALIRTLFVLDDLDRRENARNCLKYVAKMLYDYYGKRVQQYISIPTLIYFISQCISEADLCRFCLGTLDDYEFIELFNTVALDNEMIFDCSKFCGPKLSTRPGYLQKLYERFQNNWAKAKEYCFDGEFARDLMMFQHKHPILWFIISIFFWIAVFRVVDYITRTIFRIVGFTNLKICDALGVKNGFSEYYRKNRGVLRDRPVYSFEEVVGGKMRQDIERGVYDYDSPNYGKRNTVDPQGDAPYDACADQIASKILNRNSYEFHLQKSRDPSDFGRAGYLTFVAGNIALIPYHFVTRMQSILKDNPEYSENIVKLVKSRPSTGRSSDMYKFTVKQFLDCVQHDDFYERTDMCLVALPRSIVQPHPWLIRYFGTKEDVKNIRDWRFRLMLPNKNGVTYENGRAKVLTTPLHIKDPEKDTIRSIKIGFEYDATTAVGDCGALFFCLNRSTSMGCIFGMHIAGKPQEGLGFSTLVTREDLKTLLDRFDKKDKIKEDLIPRNPLEPIVLPQNEAANMKRILSECLAKDPHNLPILVKQLLDCKENVVEQQMNIEELPVRFSEVLKISEPVSQAGKTRIVRSRMFGKWVESTKAPARLRPFVNDQGDHVDPIIKSISKYCANDSYINPELVIMARDHYSSFLHRNSDRNVDARILTFEEAILGVLNDSMIKSVNRNTSAGFPFIMQSQFKGRGKTKILGTDDVFNLDTAQAQEIRWRVTEIIVAAKNNKRLLHVCTDFPKDEVRDIAKVREGNTRLISGAPFDLLVASTMYFGQFASWFMRNKISNGSGVGMNVYSHDWHRLAQAMRRKCGASPRCGAGDYSRFDATQKAVIQNAILDIINGWYSANGSTSCEDDDVRRILWCEITNSRHVYGDLIYSWYGSLPSGHYLTTIVNTMYNQLVFRIAWQSITLPGVLSLREFEENVYVCAYGDDNIFAVSNDYKDIFTEINIGNALKEIGMVYTSETKHDLNNRLRCLDEIEFLKRKFRFCEEKQRYVAPLRMDTVLQMPYWTKKIPGQRDSIAIDNLNKALEEPIS